MKLKKFIHAKPGKLTFGTTIAENKTKKDTASTAWIFTVGLFSIAFGVILLIISIALQISLFPAAISVLLIALGAAMLLIWKKGK